MPTLATPSTQHTPARSRPARSSSAPEARFEGRLAPSHPALAQHAPAPGSASAELSGSWGAGSAHGSNGVNPGSHGANPGSAQPRPRAWALQGLPVDVWRRLEPQAQRTLLFQGQVLHEPGSVVERVYFPNSGMVSLVLGSANGEQVEVAMAGREGAVGALELLSDTPATETAVVQVPGTALWLPASVVRDEFGRGGAFHGWTLRFWSSLMAQKSQAALCNRLHSVEERLCRWLLGLRERVESDEIEITHGSIAQMLGARRSGVTVALGALGALGLLDTGRGHIVLLDIEGLRANSCSCHLTLSRSLQALKS